MSLLDDAFTEFKRMVKTSTKDGYGGLTAAPAEGSSVYAAVAYGNSLRERTAIVEGDKTTYTVITKRADTLNFHEVIKRVSDNKYFRITSDSGDNKTPVSAALDMRAYTAEEYTYE